MKLDQNFLNLKGSNKTQQQLAESNNHSSEQMIQEIPKMLLKLQE